MAMLGSVAAGGIIGSEGGVVGGKGFDVVSCISVHVIGDDGGGNVN